jgi:dipeptidyl aminopeptidase/acylaminoacyl peptidase
MANHPFNEVGLERLLSNPFPSELVAAPSGARVAWVFNDEGKRNVWFAQAPDWKARPLTRYDKDDGQELTSISISGSGDRVVFVRGGEHGGNTAPTAVNPDSGVARPTVAVCSAPTNGGEPRLLGEGDFPEIDPSGTTVAYVSEGRVFLVPIDGSKPAKPLGYARGTASDLQWSPDGSELAFTLSRVDHSFVAVYRVGDEHVRYLAPDFSRDIMPRWSPDGKRLAFVRVPGIGGRPRNFMTITPLPWEIWVADAKTGEGKAAWKSPNTPYGSISGPFVGWTTPDRIVFTSTVSGWTSLHSVSPQGGEPVHLTPGKFITETVSTSPGNDFVAYSANAGPDADDVDRRHLFRVGDSESRPRILTPGPGLETSPVLTADGRWILFTRSDATSPPWPCVMPADGGAAIDLAPDQMKARFGESELVVPRAVRFRSG